MKASLHIGMLLFVSSCVPSQKEEVSDKTEIASEEAAMEYEEGENFDFNATGYSFNWEVYCDTLSEEELTDIVNSEGTSIKIILKDSIHISYLRGNDSCGFYEGYYDLENDTIRIHDRQDAWDGCGGPCLFVLKYTIPKPEQEEFVISINDSLFTIVAN